MNYWQCPDCEALNPNEETRCHRCRLDIPDARGVTFDPEGAGR